MIFIFKLIHECLPCTSSDCDLQLSKNSKTGPRFVHERIMCTLACHFFCYRIPLLEINCHSESEYNLIYLNSNYNCLDSKRTTVNGFYIY